MNDVVPWIGLAVSILTGPVVLAAVAAMHKSSTTDLIEKSLDKQSTAFQKSIDEERERTRELIRVERERNGEVYALKHEVSEMKGHVMQLVTNTAAFDAKLDRMQELLIKLERTR